VPIERDKFEDGIARPMHTVLAQNKINQLNIFVPMWDDALNRYIRELN
jgi:dTDP-4-dehydrorhamnose reductase